jgi:hypothetical protein
VLYEIVCAEEPSKVCPVEAPEPELLKVTALGTFKTLAVSCPGVEVPQECVAVLTSKVGAYLAPVESDSKSCPNGAVGTVDVPVPPLLTGTTLL